MITKQYKCLDCSAIFEAATAMLDDLSCLACEGVNVSHSQSTFFYANKNFCPHDKKIEVSKVKVVLGKIMADSSLGCKGCGVDGPKGSCDSSSGECGNCTCGKGAQRNKLKLDLYSNDLKL